MALIEFNDITKEYEPGYKALDDIIIKIDSGEFVFLVGPSGAGKSSLVKLLIREELPNVGDITFDGESVPQMSLKDLPTLRRRIGVVFQDFKLLDSRNVFENVAIALEVVGSKESEIKNIVPNVLSLVGLTEKMFKYPKQLSGGERQRVAIARALAHEPDVLIADEPTGMIDPDSAEDLISILQKVNDLGTTVIMASHDEKIVDRLKKRVVRIEGGKVVSDKKGGKYRG